MDGCFVDQKEIIQLDVFLDDIPKNALAKKVRPNGGWLDKNYYTAEMEVRIEVSTRVVISVSCGGRTMATARTNL